MLNQELSLILIGFVFVVETLSVMLQVASYKLTKKRIFKMSPIHTPLRIKWLGVMEGSNSILDGRFNYGINRFMDWSALNC